MLSERDREVLRGFAARIDAADAGAHNNLGVLYYNKGMTPEAVAAFARALQLDPAMAIAERNLRIAYCESGHFDRTVAELRARLDADASDAEARRALAEAYLLAGDPGRAVPELEAVLAAGPDDAEVLAQLARATQRLGDMDAAARWLRRALERRPADARLLFQAADVAYHRGLIDESHGWLRQAIEQSPDSADAHYLLGFVLGDLGRHEEARAAARRALQLNPSLGRAHANLSLERPSTSLAVAVSHGADVEPVSHEGGTLAHYNLGLAFRQKGYFAEALREYRLALERGEDWRLVTQAMAEVHLLQHDSGTALPLYESLVAAHPESPKLWNERGVALHQGGRIAEARESYRAAVRADAAYVLALNNLGVAYFHEGCPAEAVEAFRATLAREPDFVKARLNLALLLLKRKELPLCLEAYRQVLQLEAEHPVAWNGVGLVLSEMRHFEDARNAFARAIDARPDYAEARYNLSFALSNLGDFAGALRETKQALELDPYYVAQKFELAIDLEFEHPRIAVSPDLGGDARPDGGVADFTLDTTALTALFAELAPAAGAVPVAQGADPYAAAATALGDGALDAAADAIRTALEAGAPRPRGLVLLGDVFLARGAHGEALERYRQARQLEPALIPAMVGELRALLHLGRGAQGGDVADALARVAGDDVEVLLLVARVRAERGEPARALEALDEARRLAPARADVLHQIGNVARDAGDGERAIDAYRHAIALDRDFAAARVDLAGVYVANGLTVQAERELVEALASIPTYLDAALRLAALRRSLQRPAETVALLVAALLRDPWNVEALASLGESLFQCGRREDARLAFARVLRFDREHVAALYFDGVLRAEGRRFAEAIACWQRVIALEPASEYARRARRDARTAADLQRIFVARAPGDERGTAGLARGVA